jgi:small-conductance mechanosensitive channel
MEPIKIKLIETAVVILLTATGILIVNKVFLKSSMRYNFQPERIVFATVTFRKLLFLLSGSVILVIWGVDQKDLFIFLSSFFAVLGIGLFAQWSMLSNITASLLIFINHPAKTGDVITVLDKDFPLKGEIVQIGLFFVKIRTEDHEIATIPNSQFFQKMVKVEQVSKKEALNKLMSGREVL